MKNPVILQEGRPYKECAKLGEGEGVSPECVGIRMTYYRCKRGQVGQSFCHFEVCMGAKSSSIDTEASKHPLQLLNQKMAPTFVQGHFRAARDQTSVYTSPKTSGRLIHLTTSFKLTLIMCIILVQLNSLLWALASLTRKSSEFFDGHLVVVPFNATKRALFLWVFGWLDHSLIPRLASQFVLRLWAVQGSFEIEDMSNAMLLGLL